MLQNTTEAMMKIFHIVMVSGQSFRTCTVLKYFNIFIDFFHEFLILNCNCGSSPAAQPPTTETELKRIQVSSSAWMWVSLLCALYTCAAFETNYQQFLSASNYLLLGK